MSYILIYHHKTYGDYGFDWEECSEQYDTYNELIEYIALLEIGHPGYYRWINIFKSEQNMLELYIDDVNKRHTEILEERKRKAEKRKALEAELKREREAQYMIEQEERERALFEELSKKYGNKSE